MRAAALGRSALVCTIDPARRLANALGLTWLGNAPTEVSAEVLAGAGIHLAAPLQAMMLDLKASWDDLIQRQGPPGPGVPAQPLEPAELLDGPGQAAELLQAGAHAVAQPGQVSGVVGGILEHGLGQGPPGPVGLLELLRELHSLVLLEQRGECGCGPLIVAELPERASNGAARLGMLTAETFDKCIKCGLGANLRERRGGVGLHAPELVAQQGVLERRRGLWAAFFTQLARSGRASDRLGQVLEL